MVRGDTQLIEGAGSNHQEDQRSDTSKVNIFLFFFSAKRNLLEGEGLFDKHRVKTDFSRLRVLSSMLGDSTVTGRRIWDLETSRNTNQTRPDDTYTPEVIDPYIDELFF